MSDLTSAPGAAPLEPVAAGERVHLIDILRGFALFGILLVNFQGATGSLLPAVDPTVASALEILVTSSFYPLFSFLFGLGFAIQLDRAAHRGGGVAAVYFRRMLALLLIGTAHAVLVWDGDILVNYALFGLLLIPLHRLRPNAVLGLALLLLVFGLDPQRVTSALGGADSSQQRELAQGIADEEMRIEAGLRMRAEEASGGLRENIAFRWARYGRELRTYADWSRILSSDILMAFLIGLFVGRRGWLQNAHAHRRGFAIALITAAILATAGTLYVHGEQAWGSLARSVAWLFSDMGLTVVYICAITLLVTQQTTRSAFGRAASRAGRALHVLAPAGRMALTLYLMQSVVMTLLLYPYGLGITDPGTALMLVIHCALFFLVQVPLSHWWLARYRFGPAEWLWRSLTYGTPQPMRQPPQQRPAQELPTPVAV